MIEAEGAVPERARDVGDAVFPQDVEGETAHPCHDAGIVVDAAFVLTAAHVADIVVAAKASPTGKTSTALSTGYQMRWKRLDAGSTLPPGRFHLALGFFQ